MSDVTITIEDNSSSAAVSIDGAKVQVKIGPLLTGIGETAVVNQIVAASQPSSLRTAFVAGKLLEAAGLVANAGGIVLAIGCPITTDGTATSVVSTVPGGSTSVVTLTLDATNGAFDDYNCEVVCTAGGTIGVTGIRFKVSLDAGRNYGAEVSLGTANTYEIPNTGVTLNFGAGDLEVDDYWRFSTTAPKTNTAGLQAAIDAFAASDYALAGVGMIHIVQPLSGTEVNTLQGWVGGSPDGSGGIAADHVYTRVLVDTVDATTPVAWGGAGQTEAAWMAAVTASYASADSKRTLAGAGYYNTPSVYQTAVAGLPSYRRCASWSIAARQVAIPISRLASRVIDGALATVTKDSVNDPLDGFVYHDEALTPGLAAARFATFRTWKGKRGWFVDQPYLMAQAGSDFSLLPFGLLVDQACRLVYAKGLDLVNDDLQANPNGTLPDDVRVGLEDGVKQVILDELVNPGLLSGCTVAIDPLWNVVGTGEVPFNVSLNKNAYVFNVGITIGFAPAS